MHADRQGTAHDRVPERDCLAEVAMLRETCRRQASTIATMTRVFANLRQGVGALKAENAALRAAPIVTAGGEAMRPRERADGAARSSEVHVIPQPRTATWGVYLDAVSAALSEHTSETEAESAARAHVRTGCTGGIVVHDRYHRTHTLTAAHAD
jgi:hypothetical protein